LKLRHDVNKHNQLLVTPNFVEIKKFIEFLSLSAKNYAFFFNKEFFETRFTNINKTKIGDALKNLRCQPTHASMMPLILAIMARFSEKEIDYEILELIEKVNFRTYILPKVFDRADSQQAYIYYWAWRFYNNYSWEGEERTTYNNRKVEGSSYNLVKEELKQFTKYFCNKERFISGLRIENENDKSNYYDWEGLRYYLAKYEEFLQRKKKKTWDLHLIQKNKKNKNNLSNDYFTKEHIWASKNCKEDFPENHIQKRRLDRKS